MCGTARPCIRGSIDCQDCYFIIQRPLVDTKILDWIYAENRRTMALSTENIAIMAN